MAESPRPSPAWATALKSGNLDHCRACRQCGRLESVLQGGSVLIPSPAFLSYLKEILNTGGWQKALKPGGWGPSWV